MQPQHIATILKRFAELVESKIAVSKSARQVAQEVLDFDKYCTKHRVKVKDITTENLRTCYYKDARKKI